MVGYAQADVRYLDAKFGDTSDVQLTQLFAEPEFHPGRVFAIKFSDPAIGPYANATLIAPFVPP